MKTYVLIISQRFPKAHPRSGEDTNFVLSIKFDIKIHTIRNNYELWRKRFEAIDKGEAQISVRMWSGKPYRSKQQELFRIDKSNGIGLQKVKIFDGFFAIDGDEIFSNNTLAKNDGLSPEDFNSWFKDRPTESMGIIHFTSFRYSR